MVGALGLAAAGVLSGSAAATASQGTIWMAGSDPAAARAALVAANGGQPGQDAMAGHDAMPGHDATNRVVTVELKDVHGQRAATVTIAALAGGGNLVTVRASGLTPGFHGIHIHAVGACDPAGAKPFASAGGHFNPTGKPEGMQAGAFPVLLAGANGQAATLFTDDNLRITDLFGTTGSAIVIHSGPDNYANIPTRYAANGVAGPDAETQMTGDAGTRVACGVIARPKSGPAPSMSGQH